MASEALHGDGRCEEINVGNGTRCRKPSVEPLNGKNYCRSHADRIRSKQIALRELTLPFPRGGTEAEISGTKPWVTAVCDDGFIPELGMYQVDIVVEGELGRRSTGVWPLEERRLPWLWGPDLKAARRTSDRFNEERGYGPTEVRRIMASAGLTYEAGPRQTGSSPGLIPASKGDLKELDEVEELAGLYGSNARVYWTNLASKRHSGSSGYNTVGEYSSHIVHSDVAIMYANWAKVLNSTESYVVDLRMRSYIGEEGWFRVTNQAICDPTTNAFLLRCGIGTAIKSDQVSFRVPTINPLVVSAQRLHAKIKEIVHQRILNPVHEKLYNCLAVAFVPRQEKTTNLGFRLALATPGQQGYELPGSYPYLPTTGYYPPIFLGSDLEVAEEAARRFNAVRGIDPYLAFSVLISTKCIKM